jgi:hypothetical protein
MYLLFTFSTTLYLLPNLALFTGSNNGSTYSLFQTVNGSDLIKPLLTPIVLILLVHTSWTGPVVTAWFGHLIFSQFQFKITYVVSFFFTTYLVAFLSGTHFSSINVYDYAITLFSFFIWLWLALFSNNLFTLIFFLEILSALITLMLVTSTFSSHHFYNTTSYSNHSYFQTSAPTALLQTLLFFFWITLVSSLALFVFLLLFYLRFLTLDWGLVDSIFLFVVETGNTRSLFAASFVWLLLLVCVFVKCGIVPFYFWKPSFFKGMTLNSLFFYVYVYYFTIFFYLTYILFLYLNELFILNIYLVISLLVIATVGISA